MIDTRIHNMPYPILIPEKLVCGLSTPFELLLNIDGGSVLSFPDLFDLFDLCDVLPDLLLPVATTTTPSVVGVATPTMSGATEHGFVKTMKSRFSTTNVPSYE